SFGFTAEKSFQVGAGAKHLVTGAGNRDDAHIALIDSPAHRPAHSLEGRKIQRITLLRPVYRNPRNSILDRVKHLAHDRPLLRVKAQPASLANCRGQGAKG